jgi:tRNA (guanine-N7-)-methyltransferase
MADILSDLPAKQLLPDWQTLLGNDHPIKIEIGPGKGVFLINRAQEEPHVNFIAIEIRRKRVEHIQSKITGQGVKNAQVIWGDAKQVLTALFPPATIATFFIHFPDPWPKRKHEKHRLLDEPFVATLHRLLLAEGKVYLTTDVSDYSAKFSLLFGAQQGFICVYAESGQRDYPYHQSIHEQKFRAQGRGLYYFCFAKKQV